MSEEISLEAYTFGNGLVFVFEILDIKSPNELESFSVINGTLGYHEGKKVGIRKELITLRIDYDGKTHWNFELPKEIIKKKLKIYENKFSKSILDLLRKSLNTEKYITVKFRINCSTSDEFEYKNYVDGIQKIGNIPRNFYETYKYIIDNDKVLSFKVN